MCVCGKKFKNKVIQSKESIAKETRRYNVSILINHHQDLEKMISTVRSTMDLYWNENERK